MRAGMTLRLRPVFNFAVDATSAGIKGGTTIGADLPLHRSRHRGLRCNYAGISALARVFPRFIHGTLEDAV